MEVFKSSFRKEVDTALRKFIQWYFTNKDSEKGVSPSSELMKRCSDSVMEIFKLVALSENKQYCVVCLQETLKCCKLMESQLFYMRKNLQITSQVFFNFITNSTTILKEMTDLLVFNDEIAFQIGFEGEGFQFLLNRIGLDENVS